MAIVKMKRLRLAVMAEERDRLLAGLQRLGCVELSETAPLLDDPAWAALAHRDKSAAGPIREKLSQVNAALDTLQCYAPWKKGLLEPLPEMGVDELFSDPALESALTDAGRIGELAAKLESLSAEGGRIRAEMAALEPWKDTELPLDCKGTARCDLLFLTAPAVWDLGELEKALGEKTPLAQLSRISLGREQQYLTLLVHKSARETALAALRPFSVLRAQLGDYSGSAQENLDALAAKLRQGEKEKHAAEETLSAMGPERAGLQRAADRLRQCKVLEVNRDRAVVQLFDSSAGINLAESRVRFLGHGQQLAVSEDMLGRVFDGMGRPIDGGPEILADHYADINGLPMNPAARDYPSEFIQTGISAIDGLNTLVRGQKLPIFSGSGLPHAQLAAQIARQARVLGTETNFAVVFAAIGITFEESEYFVQEFRRTGAIDRTVLFTNLANDPAVERIATPRMALTAAEYLAFEKDMHVLVILTDITNYAEALREISAAKKEVPGRRGYPGYLYTDLATMYERAGRRIGKAGSITMIPILTMPEDDKTHPIPDLTGYITEGQIILSRELYRRGIQPPIDVLPSLSRLKDKGIGAGKTREDHAGTMNQLFAAYAAGKDAKELATILGESALSETDLLYARFAEAFEKVYVGQGYETNRSIEETLETGWKLLSILPRTELKRIKQEHIDRYLPENEE